MVNRFYLETTQLILLMMLVTLCGVGNTLAGPSQDELDQMLERKEYQLAIWSMESMGDQRRADRLRKEIETILQFSFYTGIKMVSYIGASGAMIYSFGSPYGKQLRGIGKRENERIDVKAEVAAYRIDRHLKLKIVPITVLRKVDGVLHSFQFVLPSAKDGITGNVMKEEKYKMRLLDFLIENSDRVWYFRGEKGIMFDHNKMMAGDKLIAIDHERGFGMHYSLKIIGKEIGKWEKKGRCQNIPQETLERFMMTSQEDLFLLLGDLYNEQVIETLWQRWGHLQKIFALTCR